MSQPKQAKKMRIRTYFFSFIFFIFLLQAIFVSAAGAANKIMPLGDSITQGITSGVPLEEFQVSYRKALYDRLKTAGYVDVVNDEIFVGTLFSGEFVADFDPDHDGHPGFRADEIALPGNLNIWLDEENPNVVLLHIGTNDISNNSENWNYVKDILTVIDDYETASGKAVWVVLSLIIERGCDPYTPPCPKSDETTTFNNDVRNNVFLPRQASGDKIVLVDMQNDALINYRRSTAGGDMWDDIHPFETEGYTKMADLWFTGLMNILPQADAGLDQSVNEFNSVTLDASGSSDPNSGTLSYQWVQTAGTPIVVLSDAQTVQPTFDAPDAGPTSKTLTFTLTVTNEDELVSTDTVDIVVQKVPPQADAGSDQSVNEFDTVTLDASGSFAAGGGSLSYQWTQTAGPDVILSGNQDIQPFFAAPAVGPSGEILTFELTVTDDDGLESKDTVDIAVKIKPQADAGPDQSVDEFDIVTLDGSGSIAAAGLSYLWEQQTGTTVTLSGASTSTATFTAPDVGAAGETLTFQLTVTDDDGLEDTDTVSITVHNPTSSDGGGGGGGGGGCFIATAADVSPMALHGKVLSDPLSRFAMVNWKRLMAGDISLLTPRAGHTTTPALVVAMVVLIRSCVAITLRKPWKRWLKL